MKLDTVNNLTIVSRFIVLDTFLLYFAIKWIIKTGVNVIVLFYWLE